MNDGTVKTFIRSLPFGARRGAAGRSDGTQRMGRGEDGRGRRAPFFLAIKFHPSNVDPAAGPVPRGSCPPRPRADAHRGWLLDVHMCTCGRSA